MKNMLLGFKLAFITIPAAGRGGSNRIKRNSICRKPAPRIPTAPETDKIICGISVQLI